MRDKNPYVAEEVHFPKNVFASMAVFDMTVGHVLKECCEDPGMWITDDTERTVGSVLGLCDDQVAGWVLVVVEEDLVDGFAEALMDAETHQSVGAAGKGNFAGRDQVDGTGQMVVVGLLLGAGAVVASAVTVVDGADVGLTEVVEVFDGDLMVNGAECQVVAFALGAVACMLLVIGEIMIVGWAWVVVQADSTGQVPDHHKLIDHVIGDHQGSDTVLVAVEVLAASVEYQVLEIAAYQQIQFRIVVDKKVVLIGKIVAFFVEMAVFLAVLVVVLDLMVAVVAVAGAAYRAVIYGMMVAAKVAADQQVLAGVRP